MPDYEKMYFALFNAITDAMEVLKQAQQLAEQRYMGEDSPPLIVLGNGHPGSEEERAKKKSHP